MTGPAGAPEFDPVIDAAFDAAFDFDGREIGFRRGQTVGAALVAAGIRSWRTTRLHGQPRGLFCGIGVCYDCLVVADGVPNQRACRVAATSGMVVHTQAGTGWESGVPGGEASP